MLENFNETLLSAIGRYKNKETTQDDLKIIGKALASGQIEISPSIESKNIRQSGGINIGESNEIRVSGSVIGTQSISGFTPEQVIALLELNKSDNRSCSPTIIIMLIIVATLIIIPSIYVVTSTDLIGPPSPTATLSRISFEFDTPKSGEFIQANTTIICEGLYSLASEIDLANIRIWIVLQDDFGNFYLQNPPVNLEQDGSWESLCVTPGRGNSNFLAVQVTKDGHESFIRKVKNADWSAFSELPKGSDILDKVDIISQ